MASIDLDSPTLASGGDAAAGGKSRVTEGVAGLKSYGLLYGSSPVMLDLYEQIERVASTDANIPLSLGIPAFSIGAGGDGGGIHTRGEWYDAKGRELALKRILLVSHQKNFTDQFSSGYRLTPGETGTAAERLG